MDRTIAAVLFLVLGVTSAWAPLGWADSPLFQGTNVLNLRLEADFQYVKRVAQENSGGMESEDRDQPKYFSSGFIMDESRSGAPIPAKVRARGMSNLWEGEAEFPKLRVEIDKNAPIDGTVFSGARKIRINTHVTTNPEKKFTEMGRLNNENSPRREAVAYDFARVLGLPSPGFRRARIHYRDTGSGKDFTRSALLLETDKNIAKRNNAKELSIAEFTANSDSKLDRVEGAKFFLYHALVNNDDIGLNVNETVTVGTETYRPLFNTTVFERADGTRFPIVYDLDLSTLVRGFDGEDNRKLKSPSFGLNNGDLARIAYKIVTLRHRFSEVQLQTAIDFMKSRRAALEAVVAGADVDDEGRKNAQRHIELFYQAVDIARGYRLITAENAHFYVDARKSGEKIQANPVTELPGPLRLGTPVIELGMENGMRKVEILDFHGDLAEGQGPVGYIEPAVPIASQFPDALVGKVDTRDMVSF